MVSSGTANVCVNVEDLRGSLSCMEYAYLTYAVMSKIWQGNRSSYHAATAILFMDEAVTVSQHMIRPWEET